MDYAESKTKKNRQHQPARNQEEELENLRIIDTNLEVPPQAPTEHTVRRSQLVNKLNYLNFNRQCIRITFRHNRDQRLIAMDVHPQICFSKYLACLWDSPPDPAQVRESYHLEELVIAEGEDIIHCRPGLRELNKKGICLTLPEKSVQTTSRKSRRYSCGALEVTVIQNSIAFSGVLVDFSAVSFRVEVQTRPSQTYQWLNPKDNVNLIVLDQGDPIYSCECDILKKVQQKDSRHLILKPLAHNIQRFSPKSFRSRRLRLSPAPDILFSHPFTGKMVTLKAIDLSGSGLSVEDDEANSVLLPGLIIPELTIKLANTFKFSCRAQVLYRNAQPSENGTFSVQVGIAFLDMDGHDHMRLLSLLHQAENKHLYICNDVDMEQLWRFFFSAGFMYPKKYKFIQHSREKIREIYDYLYSTESKVSRYFTWQHKGVIQGHLSMLRFYERTWLIHHLAALPSNERRVGIEVLNQIGAFTYDSHRLHSSHMDYLICYFRPENRFPSYFFGGIHKKMDNPAACTVHEFAYLHYRPLAAGEADLPDGWSLRRAAYSDLSELYTCYEERFGGLMLKALDLVPEEQMPERHQLADEYSRINLKRQRRLYSLTYRGTLKAVYMANVSDFALNLSDLTSSISVFVVDSARLDPEKLYAPVHQLAEKYRQKTFPLLVFPLDYMKEQSMLYERLYNLWTLDMEYTDEYFQNFKKLI
jgi:hypothetical protein